MFSTHSKCSGYVFLRVESVGLVKVGCNYTNSKKQSLLGSNLNPEVIYSAFDSPGNQNSELSFPLRLPYKVNDTQVPGFSECKNENFCTWEVLGGIILLLIGIKTK